MTTTWYAELNTEAGDSHWVSFQQPTREKAYEYIERHWPEDWIEYGPADDYELSEFYNDKARSSDRHAIEEAFGNINEGVAADLRHNQSFRRPSL